MTSTINASKRIFKSLPDKSRKAIIDQVINVQGLKSPMTKLGKQCARDEYGRPNMGERNLIPILFEHLVKENI